jgi:hypothetical protein
MAINFFKSVQADLLTSSEIIYTAPLGFTAIVLMAQVSNTTSNPYEVSMSVSVNSTETSLVTDFEVPANDAAGVLTGKLVLEAGQSVIASANNNSSLQLVMSILESQN